jgi:hypothetical protein
MTNNRREVQTSEKAQDRSSRLLARGVKIAAGIATVLTAATIAVTSWDQFGWVTRQAYAEEHKDKPTQSQMQDIQTLLVEIKQTQDRNQTQWVCAKLDEEIPDIQYRITKTTDEERAIKLQRELNKKEERWIVLNCSQFTD